jgi:16S rRNA processing protein RimM
MDWDDMVLVGTIARPHGIKGQVAINPETDFAEERFAVGETLWTKRSGQSEALKVATVRIQNGRPIVGFEGRPRIEDVEALVGLELRVPAESLKPLDPGTFYEHQLVGCLVETVGGEQVGEVTRIDGGAGGSLLAVTGSRGEVLVPLAAHICVEVDVDAKRIRIDPPDGLLELNEVRRRHDLPADD